MNMRKKIAIGGIIFFALSVILTVILAFVVTRLNKPEYEPAPPEAPRLTKLSVAGESIAFSPELRYYEVKLPLGNPIVPKISASAKEGIKVEVFQAFIADGKNEGKAQIFLDDGKYTNSYEVKFKKDKSEGLVLQYDDRYKFTPDYKLKEGEKFTYSVEGEGNNIKIDSNGVIKVISVYDGTSTVKAYVGDKHVDSLKVNKTVKAVIDMFIVTGQGNAAGEGGNAEESNKTKEGTAYTVELEDRKNELKDLSQGRRGFAPALAEKWYSVTGRKVIFIQTAVSDVSVTQWTPEGEAYNMAVSRIQYFLDKLSADDSNYIIDKKICLWLQGEWDISQRMAPEEYIKHFTAFKNGIKETINTEMTAIIPVRSSEIVDSNKTVFDAITAAQYKLSNMYSDVRVITVLPEQASMENGYISAGNLYYTQLGYNLIGEDVAQNLYNYYNVRADRSVKKIELYGSLKNDMYEQGKILRLKKGETIRTIALITPLYAKDTKVNVVFDESRIKYSEAGFISIAEGNTEYGMYEVVFECGGVELKLLIEYYDDAAELVGKNILYTWDFNDLNEKSNSNTLALSDKSVADKYAIQDGMIVSGERAVDFVFEKKIELASDVGWNIEWKGSLNDNGIILGNSFSTKGYIYLAPFAENMGYSIRMVDDDGKTFYLPYGEHANDNKSLNVWRINYTKESRTLTLYVNGLVVSSVDVEKDFKFTLTNLFGRYGNENVNYCYTGCVDYLSISVGK